VGSLVWFGLAWVWFQALQHLCHSYIPTPFPWYLVSVRTTPRRQHRAPLRLCRSIHFHPRTPFRGHGPLVSHRDLFCVKQQPTPRRPTPLHSLLLSYSHRAPNRPSPSPFALSPSRCLTPLTSPARRPRHELGVRQGHAGLAVRLAHLLGRPSPSQRTNRLHQRSHWL
jgi:hypothetical protein